MKNEIFIKNYPTLLEHLTKTEYQSDLDYLRTMLNLVECQRL